MIGPRLAVWAVGKWALSVWPEPSSWKMPPTATLHPSQLVGLDRPKPPHVVSAASGLAV